MYKLRTIRHELYRPTYVQQIIRFQRKTNCHIPQSVPKVTVPPVADKHIQRVLLLHKFVQTSNEEILRRQLLMLLLDNSFCGHVVNIYIYIHIGLHVSTVIRPTDRLSPIRYRPPSKCIQITTLLLNPLIS